MLTKDLLSYAETSWGNFKATVSVISENDHTHVPLVTGDELLFHFDKISEALYTQEKAPTSADGLEVTSQCVELIEFKSGFKRKITKNNFDEILGRCEDGNKVCALYWNLFFKEQKKEISELISSIRFKAIESYITLEKHIFPKCQQTDVHIPLKFVVVIDEEEIDNMEDTLAGLAGKDDVKDNHFSAIRSALRRLIGQRDAGGSEYYYDSIEVLSVRDFSNHLRLLAQAKTKE